MQLNLWPVLIIALCGTLLVPLVLILAIKNRKCLINITIILLVIYLIIMILGVWTRVVIQGDIVKVSLDYSGGWLSKSIRWGVKGLKLSDALINLFLLVPIGISMAVLIPYKVKFKVIYMFLLGLIIGFIIEVGQFVLPVYRSVQLTDVVINGISMVLGNFLGSFYILIRSKIITNTFI